MQQRFDSFTSYAHHITSKERIVYSIHINQYFTLKKQCSACTRSNFINLKILLKYDAKAKKGFEKILTAPIRLWLSYNLTITHYPACTRPTCILLNAIIYK